LRPCKDCGLDLDLVGKSHRCIPRMANTVAATDDVANTMANTTSTYRYRDVERRRAYMRDYMRRYPRRKRARLSPEKRPSHETRLS
jgi:hypothetical protein